MQQDLARLDDYAPESLPLAVVADSDSQTHADLAAAHTRVLHVINGEHYSGAERVQDLLAGQLTNFGFDVGIVCLKPDKFPAARQTLEASLYEMPMHGRIDFSGVSRIEELIYEADFSLVHAHTPRSALIGGLAAKRAGVPFVYHVHSPVGHDSTRGFHNWINGIVEHWSVRRADRLICVSPSLRAYMVDRGYAAAKTICVPNGVPVQYSARDRLPPMGTWNLGMVALFRPRKGLENLLQAIAALHSKGVKLRLRAVGPFEDEEYESAVLCLVERLGIGELVTWVGFTTDVTAELDRMHALVLPSLFGEGLPMVVLEAMSAGLPVIATRVEGVPEAVRHRETGLLCDPDSVSQLARAIETLVSGDADYAALSRQARQWHAERFSDAAMAAGVAEAYRQILA